MKRMRLSRSIASIQRGQSIASNQRGQSIASNQRGQSIVEYVLVLAVVVGGLLFVIGKLKSSSFFYKKLTEPLVKHVVYNYKYGDPTAQGWDEGTARNHIQIQLPQGATFRLFQPIGK